MDKLKLYALVCILLIIAFSAGRFSAPAKVESKTVEKLDTHETKNQDVVKITRETKRPDGTVIKETREEKETTIQRQKVTEKDTYQSIDVRPSYRVGVLYEPRLGTYQPDSGTVIAEKRLFSEVYLGLSVRSDLALKHPPTFGIGFSIGF